METVDPKLEVELVVKVLIRALEARPYSFHYFGGVLTDQYTRFHYTKGTRWWQYTAFIPGEVKLNLWQNYALRKAVKRWINR